MRFTTILQALTIGALIGVSVTSLSLNITHNQCSFLILQEVDATYRYKTLKSKWAIQRTEDVIVKLERVYGKGLIHMHDPLTGKIDPSTFGWDNRRTGGGLLGASISRTIGPGLTIDASTVMAYWLGFAKGMQYSALERDSSENIGGG